MGKPTKRGSLQDSVYFIKDIWKFVDRISNEIYKKVRKEFELNPLSFSFGEDKMKRLEVLPVIGQVNYTDESKDRIVTEENVENFNPFTFDIKSVFRKPTKFAHEKEFRFIWTLNLGDIHSDKPEDVDFISVMWRNLDLKPNKKALTSKQFYFRKEQITDRKGRQLIY